MGFEPDGAEVVSAGEVEVSVEGGGKAFRYAVPAVAAVHGGTEPDLLDEVALWQADDFWQYAMYAAVAYIRAAASRAGARCARHASTGHPAL